MWNDPENKAFAVSLMRLKFRREPKEGYMEVGESKDYRLVKIMCSLEAYFKEC